MSMGTKRVVKPRELFNVLLQRQSTWHRDRSMRERGWMTVSAAKQTN
jgi:hypothetical protein